MTPRERIRSAGFSVERGSFADTPEDRVDRWYLTRPGSQAPDRRRGKGYRTLAEAAAAAEEIQQMAAERNAVSDEWRLGKAIGKVLGTVSSRERRQEDPRQEDPEDQYMRGRMYWRGEGVEMDAVEAARFFRMAADQGYPNAQWSLAKCYERGEGIEEDWVAAMNLYSVLATEHRDPRSMLKLGQMWKSGKAGKKDPQKAFSWIREAADLGMPAAQGSLANLYANGNGVDRDVVQAYAWSGLAAENGHAASSRVHDRLRNSMTAEQIDRAEAFMNDRKATIEGTGEMRQRSTPIARRPESSPGPSPGM